MVGFRFCKGEYIFLIFTNVIEQDLNLRSKRPVITLVNKLVTKSFFLQNFDRLLIHFVLCLTHHVDTYLSNRVCNLALELFVSTPSSFH